MEIIGGVVDGGQRGDWTCEKRDWSVKWSDWGETGEGSDFA